MVTRSAPRRRAIVAQSTAVLPAPITITLRPTWRFAGAVLLASMNSRPSTMTLSPSIPRLGVWPNPTLSTAASKSRWSSSKAISTPNSMPVFIWTPRLSIILVSSRAISTGSRNAMMPYVERPPGISRFSKMVTVWPSLANSPAQERPAGPAPMMAIDRPVGVDSTTG